MKDCEPKPKTVTETLYIPYVPTKLTNSNKSKINIVDYEHVMFTIRYFFERNPTNSF